MPRQSSVILGQLLSTLMLVGDGVLFNMEHIKLLNQGDLPNGVSSRMINNRNGLDVHILQAGQRSTKNPCVLLLHGFPELAYSWRKVMVPLADAGHYVVAPDQRGYGLTKGWTANFDGDLQPFRMNNLIEDVIGLLHALDYQEAIVVGHDFGSPVAASCALTRPDIFRGVSLMSAPFAGFPILSSLEEIAPVREVSDATNIHKDLSSLSIPRKHYQWYYSTSTANEDMLNCPQGVHNFLRAYYHHKSADWKQNKPFRLDAWTANELAKLPKYYIMDLDQTMPQAVATEMPTANQIENCHWLTEKELMVYSGIFKRTGFQGGLQWYRCSTKGYFEADLREFVGKAIEIPSCFIAGENDWGVYQRPGAFETMQSSALSDLRGCYLVENAGHWVQQEQPLDVSQHLLRFLTTL